MYHEDDLDKSNILVPSKGSGQVELICIPSNKFNVEFVLDNNTYFLLPITTSIYDGNKCYLEGSLQNPFSIENANDFNNLRNYLDNNFHFILKTTLT